MRKERTMGRLHRVLLFATVIGASVVLVTGNNALQLADHNGIQFTVIANSRDDDRPDPMIIARVLEDAFDEAHRL